MVRFSHIQVQCPSQSFSQHISDTYSLCDTRLTYSSTHKINKPQISAFRAYFADFKLGSLTCIHLCLLNRFVGKILASAELFQTRILSYCFHGHVRGRKVSDSEAKHFCQVRRCHLAARTLCISHCITWINSQVSQILPKARQPVRCRSFQLLKTLTTV